MLSEEKRLLVLAGAGAGKTKTLIQRILHLIFEKNVKPSSILAITFTRNAANEMVDRLILHVDDTGEYKALLENKKLTQQQRDAARKNYKQRYAWINALRVSTFHGFGYSVLRSHVAKYFDNRFKIVNEYLEADEFEAILKRRNTGPHSPKGHQGTLGRPGVHATPEALCAGLLCGGQEDPGLQEAWHHRRASVRDTGR
ncbi:MAG: UvrD-helicase domain-containing protein [Flavobacteriales bacterium]|nr:UvrD-helicase domain-containing protein [Flavobacteriales bacterium]